MRSLLYLLLVLVVGFGITSMAQAQSADVVIIGAGGAGLAAAIEAHDAGARVIVLEKMPMVGGNTLRATGGMNAAETRFQEALGIKDSMEIHFTDTMEGGRNLNLPELVRIMVEQAPLAVHWLADLGADLSDVGRLGGSSNNRTHRPTGGAAIGVHLVSVMKAAVDNRGIEVRTNSTATEILLDATGKVTGVRVQGRDGEYVIYAPAVVVATGGYGAHPQMLVEFDPSLHGFGTTNHPGATGDGITMIRHIGGQLIHMDQIQTHPTVNPTRSEMITEAVRGNGAILVNREGQRFVNELGTRDVVSTAILEQTGQTTFLIFDDSIRKSLAAIESYIRMRIVVEGESIEDLARNLDMDPKVLAETVLRYNAMVTDGTDSDFARPDMPRTLTEGRFYGIEIGPAVHHTMGGVLTNEKTQVLGEKGPIPGLFAAGEVTGGIHGTNRLGGNALADIIVFGRIAGQQAAKVQQETSATSFQDGVFRGEAEGYKSTIVVEVTVVGGHILRVEILDHDETPFIADAAFQAVPQAIVATQTLDVDIVSGATFSSKAVIHAVKDALGR